MNGSAVDIDVEAWFSSVWTDLLAFVVAIANARWRAVSLLGFVVQRLVDRYPRITCFS